MTYTATGTPADGAGLQSAEMRTEFLLIQAETDKLPTVTGNGGKIIAVNAGGTAEEAITTTGTGNGVRATSPTLVTPTLGVATATSINKVAITQPATASTLTVADGKTLTASNTLTLTATDGSTLAIGTGGTLGTAAYIAASSKQDVDATLTSLSALGTAADKLAYTTGVDTWAETPLTAFARSILDDANEATFKATVNLEIGTDVQAYDAQLADIAGLTPTDNGVVIGNGTNFVVESGATLKASLGLTIGTDIQAYDADLTTWAGVTPGTGIATALAVNVGSAGAPVVNGGALGTPVSGVLDNCTSNTEAANNNSTQLATTAYADRLTAGTLPGAFTTLSASPSGITNPVKLGQLSNETTYGLIQFGTGTTDANCMGLYGLQTDQLYYNVPTGSTHVFNINGATIANLTATVFTAKNVGVSSVLASSATVGMSGDGGGGLFLNGGSAGAVSLGGNAAPYATASSTGLAVTGTIRTSGYTVATLPAGTQGDRAHVTDATAPAYLGALTGGGAVVCPVFKNATAWVSA